MKPHEPIAARAAAYVALYPMLLQIAKDHGYSLAVHGSLHRAYSLHVTNQGMHGGYLDVSVMPKRDSNCDGQH